MGDDRLIEILLSLTSTPKAQADLVELLHSLTAASIELLAVDAAGVLLFDEHSRLVPVAATDDSTEELERLQLQTTQGAGVESVRTGRVVSCDDLEEEHHRWPDFTRRVRAEGFRAVHAEPLRSEDRVIGGLDLFRVSAGALSAPDQRTAHHLATAAAVGITNRRALDHLGTVNEQLESALTNRIAIEQAKGFLAARHHTTPEAAFNRMRRYARARSTPINQVARAVLDFGVDPL